MTDPSSLSNFVLILTAWGGAFLAALWLSLVLWTYRDIRRRARDPLARILAVLIVAALFLPGIVIYLILRPARTLEEEYQQTLEEEALLQAIEESQLCPGCGRRVQEGWIVCPNCHTKVKKTCHNCGKLLELPWNLCPYCAAPTPGMRRADLSVDQTLEHLPENEEALEPAGPGVVPQETPAEHRQADFSEFEFEPLTEESPGETHEKSE